MELEYWRPSRDEYFLAMASLVSLRSTCRRRRVGCVLVDSHRHVIATGYNGVASGQPHCIDKACPGAGYPSGKGLEHCEAIHAEQNALLQCKDTRQIEVAYITASPCTTCVKLFMNTGCKRIVFLEEYPQPAARNLWKGEWLHHGTIANVFTELSMAPAGRVPKLNDRQADLFRLRDPGPAPTGERTRRSEVRRGSCGGESCD